MRLAPTPSVRPRRTGARALPTGARRAAEQAGPARGRPRPSPALPLALALLLAACTPGASENGQAAEAPGQEVGTAPAAGEPRPMPGRAWVIFGADTVVAEIARTEDERARGLMYRDELPEGTGMLFVFPDPSIRGFWMQNTYVPLDIAFMDASFRIVDIQQMEPLTTESHESSAPFMYALEVPQGWYEAHGIGVGDVAEIVIGG